jgi:Ca-activated chloride channel family protein
MTFDHDHLVQKLGQIQVATEAEGQLTAIGDAIGLAVARLTALQDRADIRNDDEIKSRIIILLTDGEETTGDIDSAKAAEIAKAFDIRIYTIGAGSTSTLDEASLKAVAEMTGGRYFRARDTESLKEIYATINDLEKTKIIERQYEQYADMSVDSVRLGGFTFPPLLLIPLLALLLELTLASTAYRRLP